MGSVAGVVSFAEEEEEEAVEAVEAVEDAPGLSFLGSFGLRPRFVGVGADSGSGDSDLGELDGGASGFLAGIGCGWFRMLS